MNLITQYKSYKTHMIEDVKDFKGTFTVEITINLNEYNKEEKQELGILFKVAKFDIKEIKNDGKVSLVKKFNSFKKALNEYSILNQLFENSYYDVVIKFKQCF